MQNSCKEFKKKCLRSHGKRPFCSFSPISTVPSFFKIMIGDFGKAMFIPPKFAQTLGGLVNKNMYLEDSVGNCWMVKLSEIDGSLAFQKGWQDFVLDHSISLGEIVIFKHKGVSRFTVQIYGTSGFERLQFQGKENSNNHKRKHSKNEITPDILCLSKAQKSWEVSERKHNGSDKTSSKKERVEKTFPHPLASSEMAAMKGSSEKDRVEKTFQLHLASNEMAASKCVARGVREHTYSLEESPPRNDGPVRLQNSSMINYSKAPCKIIDLSRRLEEAGRNSPIILSDDEDSGTVIMAEDESFLYIDKSKGHSKRSAKEHVKKRKENLAVDSKATKKRFLTTERKSSMVCKDAVREEEVSIVTPITPETSQSKNPKGKNTSVVNEGKMSQHEKEVAVEHIKDTNEDLAACKSSGNICLLASERNSSIIDENSVCKQQVLENNPITPVQCETFQAKSSPQGTNRLEVNEGKVSHQCSSPRRAESDSTADCTKCDTRTQFEDSWAIVTHPFANERVPPMVGCSEEQNIEAKDQVKNGNIERKNKSETIEFPNKLDDEEFVGQCYEKPETATPNCDEYEGGSLIVMGEGIRYTADEDSKDKVEVIIDASISLCAAKMDCNVLDADEAGATRKSSSLHENSPEVPSNCPNLNCNGDEQGNPRPYNKGNHADPSRAITAKSPPLVMADISEYHKHLTTIKAEPFRSVSGEFPEVDAEKITPSLKGEVLASIRTEIMGSTDVMPLNCVEFSITVSLISQSWLLLPERLPARLVKKRCLRKVVLLQDPSKRLWPVLYHESLNFIGFVGGWEDFATTNNLQLGDTCQIESIGASEPTFRVQFSNVQNPT